MKIKTNIFWTVAGKYNQGDQEDEDGEVVRAPEEGHALVVEVHALLLLGPEGKHLQITIFSIIERNLLIPMY